MKEEMQGKEVEISDERDKVFKKMFGYICFTQHAKKQLGADFKSHLPSLNHLCYAMEVQ